VAFLRSYAIDARRLLERRSWVGAVAAGPRERGRGDGVVMIT
jgi:hypothetical protein